MPYVNQKQAKLLASYPDANAIIQVMEGDIYLVKISLGHTDYILEHHKGCKAQPFKSLLEARNFLQRCSFNQYQLQFNEAYEEMIGVPRIQADKTTPSSTTLTAPIVNL